MNPDDHARARQIAAWADSPAEHAQAAETLATWGEHAIPGLRDYLQRDPQVVPQPRCFAVAMLARLQADAATAGLRAVLREHPLKSLTPAFAESEYVVKCAAMEALCARDYPELDDDIAFGVHERLRAAVSAAGRLDVVMLANALIDVLDDDVLAEAAMNSLVMLGHGASAAISPRLDAWLAEAEFNARRRLALIRALCVLHRTGGTATAALRHALSDQHPAVCAAAALVVWPGQRGNRLVDALLHGALGFDRGLADDCREALDAAGPELHTPGERALQRNAEPDLYGKLHPLSSEQHDWLAARLRRRNPASR